MLKDGFNKKGLILVNFLGTQIAHKPEFPQKIRSDNHSHNSETYFAQHSAYQML
jgi:hypothetical protein